MTNTDQVFEIEVDGPQNERLSFLPLQRRVRGRFDYMRVRESKAHTRITEFPKGIPGQRLRLNLATGEASLVEPLQDREHSTIANHLRKEGFEIPESETFKVVDVATWAFHMGRAVEAGIAKVTLGSMPSTLPGKPKTRFFSNTHVGAQEQLTEALHAQAAAFVKLAEAIAQLAAKK